MIQRHGRQVAAVVTASVAMVAASLAWAGPGAHGPNGEHLDAPSSTPLSHEATPRMEAKSEDFELVARLSGGEFTMMINRFATGEPVLGAKIEVESGPRKVVLPFHEDIGSYATNDASLLKLLAMPGTHPVVITIVAGSESDLLDGTLNVTAQAAQAFEAGGHDDGHAEMHGHGHGWREWGHKPITWILGIATLAAAAWGGAQWRRRRGLSSAYKSGAL
ncbi:hypothetical protein [Ideonella sp.]|jgi:hypothetical protein|uniref:hypothetical protein n=1 Tax=Ideonella sp. TaxID=1929293 RepID=UPI0037BF12B1